MDFIFIYITAPNKDEAKKIARYLLEKSLVACANIFPINSMYRWEGKIQDDEEVVLIVKTVTEKFETVKREVEKIHPYDTPCIVKIQVSANERYFSWLKGEVKGE